MCNEYNAAAWNTRWRGARRFGRVGRQNRKLRASRDWLLASRLLDQEILCRLNNHPCSHCFFPPQLMTRECILAVRHLSCTKEKNLRGELLEKETNQASGTNFLPVSHLQRLSHRHLSHRVFCLSLRAASFRYSTLIHISPEHRRPCASTATCRRLRTGRPLPPALEGRWIAPCRCVSLSLGIILVVTRFDIAEARNIPAAPRAEISPPSKPGSTNFPASCRARLCPASTCLCCDLLKPGRRHREALTLLPRNRRFHVLTLGGVRAASMRHPPSASISAATDAVAT